MRILAIESSCDESALAIFDRERGMAGEWVHSQVALHGEYGGVVPDLASREHLERFGPLLDAALAEGLDRPVDQIAVTSGPGLAGCLAMGIAVGKALAAAWRCPLIGVNHLRGHAFSPFIGPHQADPAAFQDAFEAWLPHVGLLVSGGNTVLFQIDEGRRVRVLAQTVDDAAGEAIDKGAKLLGMPYPGGAPMEQAAARGVAGRFTFPAGIPASDDLRFSFSGLKTSLRYRLDELTHDEISAALPDLCADYQAAVVRQLIRKTGHVLDRHPARSMGLSGGVANNGPLREAMTALADEREIPLLMAEKRHTGDNAAMIAFAAWLDPDGCDHAGAARLTFNPSWPLA